MGGTWGDTIAAMNDDEMGAITDEVAERLIRAGWVTAMARTAKAESWQFTAEGARKVAQLRELMRDLEPINRTSLWHIAVILGSLPLDEPFEESDPS